ncbi:MAG: CHASE2 domain-containing protein [Verrucomicrobia bacterium]|nr:CHASE2 domain-containing protein [Verrucomicrobiota bacterium]
MTPARIAAAIVAACLGLLLATALVPWSRLFLPSMAPPETRSSLPTLVAIEDLAGEPWPWPRLDLTLLLRAISPYRPGPVGLLLPLDAPDVLEPVQDDQLGRALTAFDAPVLPAVAFREDTLGEKLGITPLPHHGSLQGLRQAESFLAPEETLRRPARISAWKTTPEADRHIRRLPLVFRQGDQAIPSWFLEMYARSLGANLSKSGFSGHTVVLRDDQNRVLQSIPVDLRGSVPVDWESPDPNPTKMEIRSVVLASEQERIGVTPVYSLASISKKPLIIAGMLPEVDPSIDSPWGQKSMVDAVLRAWTRLAAGPLPVLHPPRWVILGSVLAAAGLGLFLPSRQTLRLGIAAGFAIAVFGAGWLAAKFGGYSGALPLSLGSALALLMSAPLLRWLETGHVR